MAVEPAVSIIIPTYNRADLLPEALESALGQTYPAVEIIVVDDGSTDETEEVIQPYLDRVRYYRTENGGPAHARNIGMRAATGAYVAFLDSDDRYVPEKLALQVAFMEAFPDVGMVSTEVSSFDSTGILEAYHLKTYHGIFRWHDLSYQDVYGSGGSFAWREGERPVDYYSGHIFRYALLNTVVMVNTVLFRREILETVGYQDEDFRYLQCYEWSLRVCKHFKVALLDIPTYLIRYHENQHSMCRAGGWGGESSGPETRKRQLTEIEIVSNVLKAVTRWGLGDPEYYAENRAWLHRRVAELHFYIGSRWMAMGEKKEARAAFRRGMRYDHFLGFNRRGFFWSMLPLRLLPLVKWVEGRWETFRERGKASESDEAASGT